MSLGRLLRAQVEAEVKTRLRSPSTLAAAFALFALSFLWIPNPESGSVSIAWRGEGGVTTTGLYNSAYVGASVAILASTFLSLIGFYLVAGSVRRDEETRLGAILAATPLSKTAYLSGKLAAHCVYLVALGGVSLAAGALVFLRYGEGPFRAADFVAPFALLVVPALASAAAWAVLFDVTPGLRRRGGLVIFFFVWPFVFFLLPMLLSGGLTGRPGRGFPVFDPTGLAGVIHRLAEFVPSGRIEDLSIGLMLIDGPLERVAWPGLALTADLVASRGLALLWSLVVLGLAVAVFDRFDSSRRRPGERRQQAAGWRRRFRRSIVEEEALPAATARRPDLASLPTPGAAWSLEPLGSGAAPGLERSVLAEARLIWDAAGWLRWPLLAAALLAAVPAAPPRPALAAFLLLLAPALSEAAAREKLAGTTAMVFSQPGIPRSRVGWKLAAALFFVLALGAPSLASLALFSPARAAAYLAGLGFVAAFATAAGLLTGGGKLFTGLYVALWYAAANGGAALDFSGALAPAPTSAPYAYLAAGLALLTCAWLAERWRSGSV